MCKKKKKSFKKQKSFPKREDVGTHSLEKNTHALEYLGTCIIVLVLFMMSYLKLICIGVNATKSNMAVVVFIS